MFRILKNYSLLISFTLIFNCNADIKEEINSNVTKSQSDLIELNKNTKPLYERPIVTYFTPGKKTEIEGSMIVPSSSSP